MTDNAAGPWLAAPARLPPRDLRYRLVWDQDSGVHIAQWTGEHWLSSDGGPPLRSVTRWADLFLP